MKLSVVVVNWNSQADLEACVSSLLAGTHGELEVIVVDNGSCDGSAEMVRERFPQVLLLAEQENLGFAEACNRGIAASSAPWVVMLNNDAVVEPGWAEAMVAAAERAAPDCGMLQSLILFSGRPGVVWGRCGVTADLLSFEESSSFLPNSVSLVLNIASPLDILSCKKKYLHDSI